MRISKNKKAYEWWQIVIAITSLLLLGVLATLYGGVFKGAGTTGKERTCQLSAIANCYGKTPIIGTETFKLDC